jgi:hypothetical protein
LPVRHDFRFFVGLKREIAIIWDKNFMVCCGVALITEVPRRHMYYLDFLCV